jgi:hypothetical protein
MLDAVSGIRDISTLLTLLCAWLELHGPSWRGQRVPAPVHAGSRAAVFFDECEVFGLVWVCCLSERD